MSHGTPAYDAQMRATKRLQGAQMRVTEHVHGTKMRVTERLHNARVRVTERLHSTQMRVTERLHGAPMRITECLHDVQMRITRHVSGPLRENSSDNAGMQRASTRTNQHGPVRISQTTTPHTLEYTGGGKRQSAAVPSLPALHGGYAVNMQHRGECESQSACMVHTCGSQNACMAHKCKS